MSNLLEYNGYHAKIEFSSEDEIFIGRVIGINDVIAFDGESISELKDMFHASIDNYIVDCAKVGRTPDKEYKGSFNIRIPPELHKKAVIKAASQNISLNQFVEKAIEREIFEYEYNSNNPITILMPVKVINKYPLINGIEPLTQYSFEREETATVWQTSTEFRVSES